MKLFTFTLILIAQLSLQAQQIPSSIRRDAIAAGVKAAAFDKVQKYYEKFYNQIENKDYISFVGFNLPSTQERLFVINLKTGKVSKFLVTHGKRSGENRATSFSNLANSEKSSLGLYKIQEEYKGKHGSSLRLDGLENGLDANQKTIPDSKIDGIINGKNSNARARAIVMHSADYATKKSIKDNNYKRLGRSQGCPAVSPADWKILKSKLKDGSLLLLYK